MDDFQYHKVFSSIDHQGRYSFWNQVSIAQWNIIKLAECFLPIISDQQDEAIRLVEDTLNSSKDVFEQKRFQTFAQKLGIQDYKDEDQKIILDFLNYIEKESLDFTLSFRRLPKLYNGESTGFMKTPDLDLFVKNWKMRVSEENILNLDQINPLYIPRNHQVQKVVEAAIKETLSLFTFSMR